MKKLVAIAACGLLLSGLYVQAQELQTTRVVDKDYTDYKVSVKSQEALGVGNNKIFAKILKKSNVHTNFDVHLKLFTPDNKVMTYKSMKTGETGLYGFDIDLKTKGEYSYIISYSLRGGVTRQVKGNFDL